MTETPDEVVLVDVLATCHTPGCGNADTPIPLSIPEAGAVMCGVCSTLIDDVAAS